MSKHTPGPWRLDGRGWRRDTKNGGEFIPVISDRNNIWICDVRQSPADANLIVESPEMYRVLQAVEAEGFDAAGPTAKTAHAGDVVIPSHVWDLIQQILERLST